MQHLGGEVEAGGAGVALDNGVGLVGHLQVGVGQQVRTGLVAGGGHGLGDGKGQAVGALGHGEGARGVLAGAVLNVGESAVGVGGDHGLAAHGGGLHGAGLDDTEGVTIASSLASLRFEERNGS